MGLNLKPIDLHREERQRSLLGLSLDDMKQLLEGLGQPQYRARQLFAALYRRRISSLDRLTEFSKELRAKLDCAMKISPLEIDRVFTSGDGTRRYLMRLGDGERIEAVWIPEPRRDTICISSQVGCPLACDFCMTARLGLKRNLSAGEIVAQVSIVLSEVYGEGAQPPHGVNVVMMGMGEPLLNYDNVMRAIKLMSDPAGLSISPRRITLSTAGIVPRIYDLGREPARPRLAISLTATTDELRDKLLPINRRYPLAELMRASREFPLEARERITFEYVMLDGINDSDKDARRLVRLLSGIRAKVNLIPHNPAPELPFHSSPLERIVHFQELLAARGLSAFIRRPRGVDVAAACGQLAARIELPVLSGAEPGR